MEQDMEVLSKLTEDQKVAFMKAFSRLAGADGHLDEDELAFIRSMPGFTAFPTSVSTKSLKLTATRKLSMPLRLSTTVVPLWN